MGLNNVIDRQWADTVVGPYENNGSWSRSGEICEKSGLGERRPAAVSSEAVDPLFQRIAFRDPAGARKNIRSLEPYLPENGLVTLERLIRQVPDPDSALNHLERYAKTRGQPLRQLFSPVSRLRAALAIFSHSHFLAETLYRHPELLEWALREEKLYRVLSREEIRSDLGWLDASSSEADVARTLGRFKRMHVLRIALRDLLGLATLAEVTLELSNLADAILQGAQEQVQQQLLQRFGRPLAPAETGRSSANSLSWRWGN